MSASRRTVLVVVVAVVGIALAAAITWGTSQLVRQHIGLASEPLTAGQRLLPPVASTPAPATESTTRTSSPTQSSRAPSTTTPSPPTPSSPTTSLPAPSRTTSSSLPSPSAANGATGESVPPAVSRPAAEGSDSGSHRDD
jgi:hypothetical protein